jgi:hypothetical protein
MDISKILKNLSKDNIPVTLVKKDGSRIEGLTAVVQPHEITVYDNSLNVEEGDKIERRLPTGRVETYVILDTGYNPGVGPVSGFYQMRVRKESAIREEPVSPSVIYNVTGANSRVNINSSDSSTNIANVNLAELFQRMRDAVATLPENEQREVLVERIDALEESQGSGDFAEKYRDFVSLAADHMSLFAPFMPALGQLFGS